MADRGFIVGNGSHYPRRLNGEKMNFRDSGYALTYVGLAGVVFVAILSLEFAPGLKPCTGGGCWGAPEAYRILYLHVPICLVLVLIFLYPILWLIDVVSQAQ